MNVTGYTFTSLRALLDQDEMRNREGKALLESYHQAAYASRPYRMWSQFTLFAGVITIPITILLAPAYSTLINGSLLATAVLLIITSVVKTYPAYSRLKRFHDGAGEYFLNTWGSRTHPIIHFLYLDRNLERVEVSVRREDGEFKVGVIEDLPNSEFSWVKHIENTGRGI